MPSGVHPRSSALAPTPALTAGSCPPPTPDSLTPPRPARGLSTASLAPARALRCKVTKPHASVTLLGQGPGDGIRPPRGKGPSGLGTASGRDPRVLSWASPRAPGAPRSRVTAERRVHALQKGLGSQSFPHLRAGQMGRTEPRGRPTIPAQAPPQVSARGAGTAGATRRAPPLFSGPGSPGLSCPTACRRRWDPSEGPRACSFVFEI